MNLSENVASAVQDSLNDWQIHNKVRRLWAHDATLWTGDEEGSWLGWLGIVADRLAHADQLTAFGKDVTNAGFRDALVLGMGGSSLCPEVLATVFCKRNEFRPLRVLDSTDPAQIRTFESNVDLANTIFIVSSKSGSTLEPNILKQYFFHRVNKAGDRFVAITDPGSKIEQVARTDGFRNIFFGLPSIGGRYSALSNFGMIPAAAANIDVVRFLERAEVMVRACGPDVPPKDNPGVMLGTILGVLARKGRDKVTIVVSPPICHLGAWLEQLLAESTGKEGKGLIPIDQEQLGPPEVYGTDRAFVYIRLDSGPDASQDAQVEMLERAGNPVVRISLADVYDLGQEFFRWEFATAVAGSIMGINPFNQPDVEASKVVTRKLTSEFEKTGSLPPETPVLQEDGIKVYGVASGQQKSLTSMLRFHLSRLAPNDYFALLAYIEMNGRNQDQLQAIRHAIRDHKGVATCLGFGPRFLHSTGQAYKGGPNTGVFLQITGNDAEDLPVPSQRYTFGVVKAAQARGDFEVLVERKRRALRVHLGANVRAGLAVLRAAIDEALK